MSITSILLTIVLASRADVVASATQQPVAQTDGAGLLVEGKAAGARASHGFKAGRCGEQEFSDAHAIGIARDEAVNACMRLAQLRHG